MSLHFKHSSHQKRKTEKLSGSKREPLTTQMAMAQSVIMSGGSGHTNTALEVPEDSEGDDYDITPQNVNVRQNQSERKRNKTQATTTQDSRFYEYHNSRNFDNNNAKAMPAVVTATNRRGNTAEEDLFMAKKVLTHTRKKQNTVTCVCVFVCILISLFLCVFPFVSSLYSSYDTSHNISKTECYMAYASKKICAKTNYASQYLFTFRASIHNPLLEFDNGCREMSYVTECIPYGDKKLNDKYTAMKNSRLSLAVDVDEYGQSTDTNTNTNTDAIPCYIRTDGGDGNSDAGNSDSDLSTTSELHGDNDDGQCHCFLKSDVRELKAEGDLFVVWVSVSSVIVLFTVVLFVVFCKRFQKYNCYASVFEYNETTNVIKARTAANTNTAAIRLQW